MSHRGDNPGQESRGLRAKRIFIRYFFVFMAVIWVVAFFVAYKGFEEGNRFLVGFGTTLLSASTIGVFFKVLGYDVYLTTLLREIIIDREYLPLLKDEELYNTIRKAIFALKGEVRPDERYKVFEKYLIDDLVGVSRNTRTYNIELTRDDNLGLIRAHASLRYNTYNETQEDKPLFSLMGQDDIVSSGRTTIPRSLDPSDIPDDPTDIFSYDMLTIDEEEVDIEPIVEWVDREDRTKGVLHKLVFHDTLGPSESKSVRIRCTVLLDINDYILRRHMNFGDSVAVYVTKPEDIDVDLDWFITAQGKEPRVRFIPRTPDKGPRSCYQRVEGVLVPGNGFVIMWWPIT